MHVHPSFINQKRGVWNAYFFPRYNSNTSTTEYIEYGITLWALWLGQHSLSIDINAVMQKPAH